MSAPQILTSIAHGGKKRLTHDDTAGAIEALRAWVMLEAKAEALEAENAELMAYAEVHVAMLKAALAAIRPGLA